MPATSLPATSILYADEGLAGRVDLSVGLGRRLSWAEAASELYPYLGKSGWSESVQDSDNGYDLGSGATTGNWVEFTGSVITVPQDVAIGEPVELQMHLWMTNASVLQAGTVDISYGIDGAEPTENGANLPVATDYDGYIDANFTTTEHGGLTAGQTLTVWSRIFSGEGPFFAVTSLPTIPEPNVFLVSYHGTEVGGGVTEDQDPVNWTGSHSWTRTDNQFAVQTYGLWSNANWDKSVVGVGAINNANSVISMTRRGSGNATLAVHNNGEIGFTGFSYACADYTANVSPLDVTLKRDGPGILALRTGTAAQTFRLYGTYSDAANYERLSLGYNGTDTFTIAAENGGTGTPKGLKLQTGAQNITIETANNRQILLGVSTTNRLYLSNLYTWHRTAAIPFIIGSNSATSPSLYGDDAGVLSLSATNANNADGRLNCGTLTLNNLPTSDPVVAGQLWNDAGTVKISAG